ncbi:hypothetical protein QTP88_006307 [Uroleucon formosanum]
MYIVTPSPRPVKTTTKSYRMQHVAAAAALCKTTEHDVLPCPLLPSHRCHNPQIEIDEKINGVRGRDRRCEHNNKTVVEDEEEKEKKKKSTRSITSVLDTSPVRENGWRWLGADVAMSFSQQCPSRSRKSSEAHERTILTR